MRRRRATGRAAKVPSFWDASALVPLCVDERISPQVQAHYRKLSLVVWWGSVVEVYGAICRLSRDNPAGTQGSHSRLQLLARAWREIGPIDELRMVAMSSLEKYSLRAGDAFQLAAALIWCSEKPSGRNFICADQHLAMAAEAAGFRVIQISA